jgi:hypothetical protein
MTRSQTGIALIVAAAGLAGAPGAVHAQSLVFSTNEPDLRMGSGARVEGENAAEIETADDFLLFGDTRLTGATIVGLLPAGAAITDVQQVVVEIYRVFPLDSNTERTPHVPTRTNSPGDNALLFRDSADGNLTFSVVPQTAVTALNSVVNGINPLPDQTTQGEGPVAGSEVRIVVQFQNPIDLRPGHYFFVPQVRLASGTFLWLSAPRPIVAPGTAFVGDLQAWVRSGRLNPDWLRVGADIVGGNPAPTFNMVLKLEGLSLCYPNCDESAVAPVLNVADFSCFLARFAKADQRANCDQSTTPPVLNVADFSCFLSSFAAGCP